MDDSDGAIKEVFQLATNQYPETTSESERVIDSGIVPFDMSSKKRMADGKTIRDEKRRKWAAKQEKREEQLLKEKLRQEWLSENSHFATFVTEQDTERIRKKQPPENSLFGENGLHHESASKDSNDRSTKLDSLLIPYVDIKDGSVMRHDDDPRRKNFKERAFIAEGVETVRLLIQQSVTTRTHLQSPIQIKSIFVKPSTLFEDPVSLKKDIEAVVVDEASNDISARKRRPPFHVLVGSEATLSRVAGFSIARGALACGLVPQDRDEAWLERFISEVWRENNRNIRLVALDGICDAANLGSIVRSASAFDVAAIILSSDCCDVWYRRAIRVSMGHVFRVPVVRVKNLATTILRLSCSEMSLATFAAVIDNDPDVVLLESIKTGSVSPNWCCVLGNEVG